MKFSSGDIVELAEAKWFDIDNSIDVFSPNSGVLPEETKIVILDFGEFRSFNAIVLHENTVGFVRLFKYDRIVK